MIWEMIWFFPIPSIVLIEGTEEDHLLIIMISDYQKGTILTKCVSVRIGLFVGIDDEDRLILSNRLIYRIKMPTSSFYDIEREVPSKCFWHLIIFTILFDTLCAMLHRTKWERIGKTKVKKPHRYWSIDFRRFTASLLVHWLSPFQFTATHI